jgi:hypothetical protein
VPSFSYRVFFVAAALCRHFSHDAMGGAPFAQFKGVGFSSSQFFDKRCWKVRAKLSGTI